VPSRPLGKCSHPGCPERTTRAGRCSKHRQAAAASLRIRQIWQPYKDPRWPALRKRVLREEPWCRDGCGERSTVADHIIPVSERPDLAFTRSNLQGLAADCHSRKTARENNFGGRHD
jgi:5-methylcytosine-specific restriction protein A